MQTLPAIAQAGLKLRAVLRNTRLPALSAFHALTSETSAFSAVSSTYWWPSNSRVSLPSATIGAVAGAGEERRDAGAAGAQALGQRALRIELELELAGQVLALEFLVLADVGRNHLPDLARGQQQAEAEAIDAGVVGDRGQALDAAVAQRGDQRLGDAAQAEAADGERLAIGDHALQRVACACIHLVPGRRRCASRQWPRPWDNSFAGYFRRARSLPRGRAPRTGPSCNGRRARRLP